MKQAVLLLKRRESNRPGQFRPKSDQEGLLYRGMGYLSGQPTKLSGDFERKKCRDPNIDEQVNDSLFWSFTCSSGLVRRAGGDPRAGTARSGQRRFVEFDVFGSTFYTGRGTTRRTATTTQRIFL